MEGKTRTILAASVVGVIAVAGVVVAALLLSGSPARSTPITTRGAEKEAAEALVAGAVLTREVMERYQEDAATRLGKIGARVDALERRAEMLDQEVDRDVAARVVELESQRALLEKSLEQLAVQSGAAWIEMRTGVDRAFDELEASLERAEQRLPKP